jgi:hypothetical protein
MQRTTTCASANYQSCFLSHDGRARAKTQACPARRPILLASAYAYGWTGHKSGSGISDLAPSIGSETTFLSALCAMRSPSYFFWSRTFLLGVGLTDLGHFGQNKEIVSVFNGSVVHFNAGIGLTLLGMCCITRQELYFQLFVQNDFGR